ncbi:MAG: hypothetical protein AAGF50_00625 [Pseudomonadota bacterium]
MPLILGVKAMGQISDIFMRDLADLLAMDLWSHGSVKFAWHIHLTVAFVDATQIRARKILINQPIRHVPLRCFKESANRTGASAPYSSSAIFRQRALGSASDSGQSTVLEACDGIGISAR